MRVCSAPLMFIAAFALIAAAPERRPAYADGQVWSYHTRLEDQSSLLKINKIEGGSGSMVGPIYHISVVGVHLGGSATTTAIHHLPVSRETLDDSVVALTTSSAAFPDSTDGIKQWRAAHGGVFNIPVSEIVELIDASSTAAGHHHQVRCKPPQLCTNH